MDKVSIVIPAYNAGKVLRKTVESVLSQSHADVETVVVDDGSTDGTRDSIADYIDAGNVKYIYQNNRGVAAARNRGMNAATGDFIALLDSDDLLAEDKVERQVRFMKESGADVSFTYFRVSKADGRLLDQVYKCSDNDITDWLLRETHFLTSTLLISRNALDRVGLLDEDFIFCEDWDWFLRMGLACRIGVLREFLTTKRDVEQSLSKRYRQKYKCYMQLYRKHYPALPPEQARKLKVGVANKCYYDAVKLIESGNAREAVHAFLNAVMLHEVNILRAHKILRHYIISSKRDGKNL